MSSAQASITNSIEPSLLTGTGQRENNILSGQYSCPLRVVALNTAEGWSRDVTEDIAVAVMNRANGEDRSIGKAAQEFLERVLTGSAPEIATVNAKGKAEATTLRFSKTRRLGHAPLCATLRT
jgi:hypothetical protein